MHYIVEYSTCCQHTPSHLQTFSPASETSHTQPPSSSIPTPTRSALPLTSHGQPPSYTIRTPTGNALPATMASLPLSTFQSSSSVTSSRHVNNSQFAEPDQNEGSQSNDLRISIWVSCGVLLVLIVIAHVAILVTVCLRRKKVKNGYMNTTPSVIYKRTSDQCIVRANEAYVNARDNDYFVAEDLSYSYAAEPTLATNTAYIAHTDAESDISCSNHDYAVASGETEYEYVSTTGRNNNRTVASTTENDISCSDAYAVTSGETEYEYVSTTGQSDLPIVTFPNKAYAFHVTGGEVKSVD